MQYIRNRNELIEWLEENIPIKAIVRALLEGEHEVLGAFREIPPGNEPGWIVKITSAHRKVWYVVIQGDRVKHRYTLRCIDSPPWQYWVGDQSDNPMYRGDFLETYKLARIISKV